MLLVTAALLTFAYYARPRVKEDISYRDAFIIGLSQAVAVLPDFRVPVRLLRPDSCWETKEQVARFSFLMVIIPILGEALLDLMKGGFSCGVGIVRTGDDYRISCRIRVGVFGV